MYFSNANSDQIKEEKGTGVSLTLWVKQQSKYLHSSGDFICVAIEKVEWPVALCWPAFTVAARVNAKHFEAFG